MARDTAPDDISALADARAAARRARDWATADELKARIEAAGWRVVDSGTMYDLERAVPADVMGEDGTLRYGASGSVPSRLDEAPVGAATVVVVARSAAGLASHLPALIATAPDGTQLVIVADEAVTAADGSLLEALGASDPGAPGLVTEVVRLAGRQGHAAALNAGIRRASAPVVLVLDPGVEPRGDLVSACAAALDDPAVAVAGPFGLVTDDLRRFDPAPAGAVEVVAIDGAAMAFRRLDYAERGPLDERFTTPAHLDAWWSLVLRDVAEDAPDDAGPRRAIVAGAELVGPRGASRASGDDRTGDRQEKKAFYRLLKEFATRRDLLVDPGQGGRTPPP